MTPFHQHFSKYLSLASQIQGLETQKTPFIDNQNYKAAAQLREQIKHIETELAALLQTIRNELENLVLSTNNLHDYQIRFMFLQQFKPANPELTSKIKTQLELLAIEKQKHLGDHNFAQAEIIRHEINALQSISKNKIANFLNFHLQ